MGEAPGPSFYIHTSDDVATHLDGTTSLTGPDTHDALYGLSSTPSLVFNDASMEDPNDYYVALAAVGDRSASSSYDETTTASPSTRTTLNAMTHISAHG